MSEGVNVSILGTRVVRTEDPALLTVGGTYVDDLRVPELTWAARATFVRSPVAHASIGDIDVSAALAAPGIIAVLTARDTDDLPPPPPDDGGDGSEGAPVPMGGPWSEPLLAIDRVRYVGEPVAIVLTEDSYQGVDAAEQVIVDYRPLPVVLGPGAADAETLLFPRASSNVAVTAGVPADESAFDGCDVVVRQTVQNQRLAPVPMEGRATAAELPSFELVNSETPTDVNPLGAKGIGEAGTIGAVPAVQNAVIDALSPLGVRHIDIPATPARVWAAISEARESR